MRHPGNSPVPSFTPLNEGYNSPALSPSISFHKHQHKRNERISPAPASSYLISPPPLKMQGPVISPAFPLGRRRKHYAPAPFHSGSSPVPLPSPMTASRQTKMPLISPKVSPSVSPLRSPKVPPPPPVMSFPPPPPNEDCSTTICTEPYTNAPPGSPCGCVLPMQVGLRLSVALYTFFPLVSELAEEIAAGVFMKQSQVRIIGANAASEQPEKTVVLIDLVPLGEKIDNTTSFLTYQRFWHKQVAINTSLFGDYEVLYVRYLGLPSSPPLPSSDIGIIDGGPYSGNENNAREIEPLGVDVHGKQHKYMLSGAIIALIVLSMLVALLLCSAIAWVLLFKLRDHARQQAATPRHPPSSLAKPSGSVGSMVGSGLSSTLLSFGSSVVAYTRSAKTFSASDVEKATDNFDASRILGEGGFGRVYSGVLEDGTKVAVKVLKRDDQQGGREFLAEVEMLSRLHHRNLVKLIGICTEERNRSLIYELIPNGSVESHLHGFDKDSAPLDWDARIKIALGAARGLAYLHEDSSPCVIHRDFKSSNILLEHDFTPKLSDFGLARTAMDEEGKHVSTRVMGTFGYVAPEYAMTGHLLVKSDVYSYGVVLLELLTGKKPVDMTQPPGQENLVAWARPLLASKEGLETIVDPSLGLNVPFDSVAKVAAIASMCVQPEVSNRPFMGEVVQALKLVCNECDEAKEVGSSGSSQDDLSIYLDARVGTRSGQSTDPMRSRYSVPNYDSSLDTEIGLSASDLFSSPARFGRHCSSGPLRTGRGSRFWQKMQRLSGGSISEHGVMIRFWPGSH
ncbi:receptor-like serine/threonine-protein kinase ALE2 [Durio zibethinus]|uniref:Receptor-like serine/threonine-protein kinase ALE2 n=1 Tax=Durio zibethinus TaxID=66656 RepID=A0A6P5ZPS4_DURZI|nr:receptor-like serine/threonine-protein kinase ALE2 [Durio zibethinus]